MPETRSHPSRRFIFILPLLLLFPSCASLRSNAFRSTDRLPQASDSVTGAGQLAVSSVRATGLAIVRQPATTIRTGLAVLWHRPREIVAGNIPLEELAPVVQPAEIPGTPEFERLLDEKGLRPPQPGSLSWLVDGKSFFPELDRQIEKARASIDVQVFIYDNDDIAVRYSDKFKAKAEQVPIRVLFDDLGSTFAHGAAPETPGPPGFVPPVDIAFYLRENSHVRVRRSLNPWLVCDHTKLLVFDKQTAIMGGMNIGREYFSEWHDLMVKVEGPVVGSLGREFNRAWRKASIWGDFSIFHYPKAIAVPKPGPRDFPVRLLRTDAARGETDVMDAGLLAIHAARKRIWIENPYFAHDETARALEAAARRGVDVRVILPERGDSTIMDAGNMATARGLIQAGAKVYRYPRMTHMKVMVCDGWASVGSANLDTLSLRINRELNLAFSDATAIRSLESAVFQPDFRASRLVKLEETQAPGGALAETIADQL
ncbi:phospholipase D-like domain-containing protein [Luteolibacter luteus]|uniref:Phosphatidylserine/phosphatidylglycerophosphate/ cardiolipin synthase family protein n=1 Tax=Luteolibacter luteus TaxID=2728835 RepID=A0A858RHP3_9BACT|nr:phosphatidylserine/phosphatidylglycerophosphate/cardiolipin synthase family protein [Luteolibacter luteus]QJE96397.1 phosphatidylserine/phosphatidylglycerophosphate/cardiolipin synthase family protein [Luteolibacter luteus]